MLLIPPLDFTFERLNIMTFQIVSDSIQLQYLNSDPCLLSIAMNCLHYK